MNAPQKLIVSTVVAATLDQAWEAFTDSDAITKWNFASDDWHCPSAQVDLRVGGRHRARMEARDGSVGFDLAGTYEVVSPPHSIILVLDDGRRSHTTFEPVDTGTVVTTTFDAESEAPAEMQQRGWQAILDNYRQFVADKY